VDVELLTLVQGVTKGLDAVSLDHRVRADIEPGLTTGADPAAVHRVLSHLLDNAVKYSPAGGDITVVGHRTAEGLAIMVVDEGVGLPEGIDIFEAFQRGDSTQVGDAPGIGLGLHIVRNLVEAMKGSVVAHSDAVAGTAFTVNLPGPGPDSPKPWPRVIGRGPPDGVKLFLQPQRDSNPCRHLESVTGRSPCESARTRSYRYRLLKPLSPSPPVPPEPLRTAGAA